MESNIVKLYHRFFTMIANLTYILRSLCVNGYYVKSQPS